MSHTYKSGLILTCALLQFACSSAVANEPIASTPPNMLAYTTGLDGVGFAPLFGNRFEEAYMAMVHLPAGLESPAHVKSADMFGVIIEGEMVHIAADATNNEEVRLPSGSFYHIPAGVPHISKCVSEADCVTFLYQDGKFDFNVVTP